ncbi:MAG: amidohydrolase [Verrucomicrobia bacterium]|nr:amidohydrolase [Verrucomicrobiota bacterium]
MRFVCLAAILLLLSPAGSFAQSTAQADFVITNANVITVNPQQKSAQAVAIQGNKILFVGNNAETARLISPKTRVLDAKGKTVMPGIYDGHVHSYRASVSESGGGAPLIHSIAEAQSWIRKQAAMKPEGSWIILERVYASRLQEQRLPTRKELDEAAPNNPVHWNSGPVSVANSKALEISGITRDTPQPAPGEIVKNADGEPTGLLRNAAHLLKGAVSSYRPSAEEHRTALKKLHSLYNQQGITSIGERRTDPEAIDLFRDLAKSGELSVRVNCTRLVESPPKTADEAIKRLPGITNAAPGKLAYGPTGVGDDWVRMGPLKLFLDGGMLIGTAYMREPWGVSDMYQITDPEYRGVLNVKPEVLNPLYLEAAKQGWQLTAHCTGDASPGVLLDCYEHIAKELGLETVRNRRFQITHANFMDRENFERCRRMKIGADIQPAWLYKDGATLLKVLGEKRMEQFQPLRMWFRQGLYIGGGSDHMVQLDSIESTNPWNPWLGMWIALSRQTERGGILGRRQRIMREQAIRFYTINNAYLNHEEKVKGSLEPGKLADLIVIDRDILNCRVEDVRHTKVLMTMVDGKIVWQAESTE